MYNDVNKHLHNLYGYIQTTRCKLFGWGELLRIRDDSQEYFFAQPNWLSRQCCMRTHFQETFSFTDSGHIGYCTSARHQKADETIPSNTFLNLVKDDNGQWASVERIIYLHLLMLKNQSISLLRSFLSQRLGSFWLIINHPAANVLVMLLHTVNSLICNPQCLFNWTMVSICCSLSNVFVKTKTLWCDSLTEESVADSRRSASPKSLISCFKSAQMVPSGGNRLPLAWQPCRTLFNFSW